MADRRASARVSAIYDLKRLRRWMAGTPDKSLFVEARLKLVGDLPADRP
jgi:hypothetical protein